MKNKIVIVLVVVFGLQMIISCCKSETIERTIVGVSSRTLVLEDGFRFVEITDQNTIDKEDLMLDVVFQKDRRIVSNFMNDIDQLGIQSAYASIDCEDDILIEINTVERVEVFVIDTNNTETEVTDDLVIQGTQESIVDFFTQDNQEEEDGFVVQFNDVSNLPAQAQFRVRVFLDDNTIVEIITSTVNFN